MSDLHLLKRNAHIQRQLRPSGMFGPPKSGKSRWVDLPKQLCDELSQHIAQFGLTGDDPLFAGDFGGPLNHNAFYQRKFRPVVTEMSERGFLPTVEIIQEDGEIKTFQCRFHDLRHTCVAMLISKQAQQYEVMEHLGHTKIQTTIDIYGHMFPKVRERIRTSLEDVWASAA